VPGADPCGMSRSSSSRIPRRAAVIDVKDTADVAIGEHNTKSEAHLPSPES
jgi:hypothetical protein